MVDIGGALSGILPSGSSIISGISNTFFYLTILIIVGVVLIAGGVGVYFLVRYMQFNKKIQIWEERNGQMEYVGKDRAKELKYNIYGDSVFVLKKRKKFLPRGEIKSGRNLYLYCIREDGEWVNILMTSVNQELKSAGVKFIHPDMRAFKSGTAKIMKDRYEKINWIKEYGPIILPIVVFVILSLAIYFIADKVVSGISLSNAGIEASNKVLDKVNDVLSSLNNICSTSGYKPAG